MFTFTITNITDAQARDLLTKLQAQYGSMVAVTPAPVTPPVVTPAPAVPVISGYENTRTLELTWGDASRKYSSGLHEKDLLVIKFTVPANAPLGSVVGIYGGEWIDNGQPREACLSLIPGDFSGTSLGLGSMSEGTSFGVTFMVGPRPPRVNIRKPGYPGILPGQTAYLNVRCRGGGNDGSIPCNVFVSMK